MQLAKYDIIMLSIIHVTFIGKPAKLSSMYVLSSGMSTQHLMQ